MLDRARQSARAASLEPGEWAVDVGGGYGRHAATWLDLGLRPIVVDPAAEMHQRARRERGVHAVRGRWQRLPFVDGSLGLVYGHLSIHYGDPKTAIDEVIRVLRPGGAVSIWTLGSRHHETSFLARWFPSVPAIDAARFPDPRSLIAYLERGGTATAELVEVDAEVRRTAGQFEAAVAARFVSTLQLVPEAELAAGLGRFRLRHPDPDEELTYLLRYDWVRAHV